jgi:hypothetical protein
MGMNAQLGPRACTRSAVHLASLRAAGRGAATAATRLPHEPERLRYQRFSAAGPSRHPVATSRRGPRRWMAPSPSATDHASCPACRACRAGRRAQLRGPSAASHAGDNTLGRGARRKDSHPADRRHPLPPTHQPAPGARPWAPGTIGTAGRRRTHRRAARPTPPVQSRCVEMWFQQTPGVRLEHGLKHGEVGDGVAHSFARRPQVGHIRSGP